MAESLKCCMGSISKYLRVRNNCFSTETNDLLSFTFAETHSFYFPANSGLSLADSISYLSRIKADHFLQVTIAKVANKERQSEDLERWNDFYEKAITRS